MSWVKPKEMFLQSINIVRVSVTSSKDSTNNSFIESEDEIVLFDAETWELSEDE